MMIIVVFVVRISLPEGTSLAARFGLLVFAGGAAYLATLLALHQQRIVSFVTMMKGGLT
jgi:hypothetical protein